MAIANLINAECIEKVAQRECLDNWQRGFVESIAESIKKYGRLSERQQEVFLRIVHETSPEAMLARDNWRATYAETKRDRAIFAAKYYKQNPPYYSGAAESILEDPDYVPSEKLYRKMVENKYVTRAWDNENVGPLYQVGGMARVRDNTSTKIDTRLEPIRGKLVMIIDCQAEVLSATRGTRKYSILPVGTTEVIELEERFLKKAKI